MKEYELSILFHPDLEMNLDPVVNKVKKLIEDNGGKITKEENDGKKRLAYSINGQDFAVYYFIDVELPAQAPAKLSSVLNITDEVLRYLLVRVDERKAKYASRRKEKEEDSTEEESNEKQGE
ncbi:30S ribosomal protein S6 [Candidatus Saccharibacteria bacterium]|nr:30S ribosomal protein S6 [Candidatus Saccharibacteria bacterium]